MNRMLMLAVALLLVFPGVASARDCYARTFPRAASISGPSFNITVRIRTDYWHYRGHEVLSRLFKNRAEAVRHAEDYGGCVENYGFILDRVDWKTREVLKGEKVKGFSVWKY